MEPLNFHFLAILAKKGTFGTQWQSLINSPNLKDISNHYPPSPTLPQHPLISALKADNVGKLGVYFQPLTTCFRQNE